MATNTNVAAANPPTGLRPKASTWAYFAAIMALGLVSGSHGPTVLGLVANTGSDISQMSYIVLIRSGGYMLGSLIAGTLIDVLPGNRVMGVAILIAAICMFFIPLTSVLILLGVFMFIVGLSSGHVDTGTNTLLVWTQRDGVGPYMNALHFFFGVGSFIAPIIVVQLMERTGGLTGPYWVLAFLIIPVGLWLLTLPSPHHAPSTASVKKEESTGITDLTLLILVSLFMFVYVGAEVSFGGWIYTYAATLGLANEMTAGYLTSAFWGALTIGRLVGIPIAAIWRPSRMLSISIIGSILSIVLILLFKQSVLAMWAGTLGLGFFNATIFATAFLWAERRMELTGAITRWFFVGASLGGMIFPWMSGQLIDKASPYAFMYLVLLLFVANLIVFWVLMRVGGPPRQKEALT